SIAYRNSSTGRYFATGSGATFHVREADACADSAREFGSVRPTSHRRAAVGGGPPGRLRLLAPTGETAARYRVSRPGDRGRAPRRGPTRSGAARDGSPAARAERPAGANSATARGAYAAIRDGVVRVRAQLYQVPNEFRILNAKLQIVIPTRLGTVCTFGHR